MSKPLFVLSVVTLILLSGVPSATIFDGLDASPDAGNAVPEFTAPFTPAIASWIEDFEGTWLPVGWSQISYNGKADWYKSGSGVLPIDPPSYYHACIEGDRWYSAAGILQSRTYDTRTTYMNRIEVVGYLRDVNVDNGDVLVYFRDNTGAWDFVCDLNIIHTSHNFGNNWYMWSWTTTDAQYVHQNFAIRYYAKSITIGEIAGLDHVFLDITRKYWVGGVASNSQMYEAFSVETTLQIPTQPPSSGAPQACCHALLSVFDSKYSYDQLGIMSQDQGDSVAWRVYAGWTTGAPNFQYHWDDESPTLSLGVTYRFVMSVGYGYVGYTIWQGTTQVYSFNTYTGASYFRIERNNQYSSLGFTVYEEVTYGGDFYVPEMDFWFYTTKVDGVSFGSWSAVDQSSYSRVELYSTLVFIDNYPFLI